MTWDHSARFFGDWHSRCNHKTPSRVKTNIQPKRSRAMNRITTQNTETQPEQQGHPGLRAEKRLRRDVESMLRDMAFVLKMTQRVKAEILNTASETLAV